MNLQLEMKIDVTKYYPLINKIISKYDSKYRNELFNECYIQLVQLSERFNPSLGNFESFSFKRLKGCCNDFITANSLNHQSLDEYLQFDGEDLVRKSDLIEDEFQLEDDIINKDYINHHNLQLTQIEKFIQKKFYEDGLSVKNIIKVYQPFHLIKSEKTIRKILKK